MFSKWLNHEEGTGHKERTWGTVLTALEDAGRGDLATAVLDELIVKHEEGLCGGSIVCSFQLLFKRCAWNCLLQNTHVRILCI